MIVAMPKLGFALLAGVLLAVMTGGAALAEVPKNGDTLRAIPGQPICSNVDELVAYIRTQMGFEKNPGQFKSCGPMPTGVPFTIVQISNDDPDIPVRPARIKVTAPGGAGSITGWTVLVTGGGGGGRGGDDGNDDDGQ